MNLAKSPDDLTDVTWADTARGRVGVLYLVSQGSGAGSKRTTSGLPSMFHWRQRRIAVVYTQKLTHARGNQPHYILKRKLCSKLTDQFLGGVSTAL